MARPRRGLTSRERRGLRTAAVVVVVPVPVPWLRIMVLLDDLGLGKRRLSGLLLGGLRADATDDAAFEAAFVEEMPPVLDLIPPVMGISLLLLLLIGLATAGAGAEYGLSSARQRGLKATFFLDGGDLLLLLPVAEASPADNDEDDGSDLDDDEDLRGDLVAVTTCGAVVPAVFGSGLDGYSVLRLVEVAVVTLAPTLILQTPAAAVSPIEFWREAAPSSRPRAAVVVAPMISFSAGCGGILPASKFMVLLLSVEDATALI
mmetsp:Transcript_24680/g.54549  ORF Transcript_24680/g.54549 Transcript_24680/m.54549 type:complete len:261 (-) Transcript_24680:304-1086(-)